MRYNINFEWLINKSRISHGLVPDDPSSSSDGVGQVFVAAALQPCMGSPLVVEGLYVSQVVLH